MLKSIKTSHINLYVTHDMAPLQVSEAQEQADGEGMTWLVPKFLCSGIWIALYFLRRRRQWFRVVLAPFSGHT